MEGETLKEYTIKLSTTSLEPIPMHDDGDEYQLS